MIIIKQYAFLPSTPAKGAPLPRGRRRRRSGLPGEFAPTAGSGPRTEAASQMANAGPPASTLARLLDLFVFYDGRVPGFELAAEGFDVPRLEAAGFISRTRHPFDFGRYLIGRALENYPASESREAGAPGHCPRSAEWSRRGGTVSQIGNLRALEDPRQPSTATRGGVPY